MTREKVEIALADMRGQLVHLEQQALMTRGAIQILEALLADDKEGEEHADDT